MRYAFTMLLCFFEAALLFGQTPEIEPPVVGRPNRFSGIVALGPLTVTIQAKSPTTVAVDEPILVHITLQGKTTRKYAPTLERLQPFLPEDAASFFIEPIPEETRADPRTSQWVFAYRLRPKTTDVKVLPMPEIAYYAADPPSYKSTLPPETEIAITVEPRRAEIVLPSKGVIDVPDSWRQPVTISALSSLAEPGPIAWSLLLGGPPLLVGGWVLTNRRRRVEGEGRRYLRQSVQRTLAHLDAATTCDVALQTLTDYLRERMQWECAEIAPNDLATQLRQRGVARELCRRWQAEFQEWDRRRFGPDAHVAADWRMRVRALILDLEADPCVARLDGSR